MMPTLSSLVAPEFVIMTFPYFYKSEMLKSSDEEFKNQSFP